MHFSTHMEDLTYNETVPAQCQLGSFRWDYPRGTVILRFPNPASHSMAVCITNSIFDVHDVTNSRGRELHKEGRQNVLHFDKHNMSLFNILQHG